MLKLKSHIPTRVRLGLPIIVNPLGQATVTSASTDSLFSHVSFVRPQLFRITKQMKYFGGLTLWYSGTMGLAEGIINDTCFVLAYCCVSHKRLLVTHDSVNCHFLVILRCDDSDCRLQSPLHLGDVLDHRNLVLVLMSPPVGRRARIYI